MRKYFLIGVIITLASLLMATGSDRTCAQQPEKLAKPMHIQATAMGQLTQLGRTFDVTVIINELSTAEDQKILLEAFQTKGNEGLVNALSKMPSKGRLAITGTLGGDLAYIRKFPLPEGGVMLRMVTNRLLRFGEVWADTRSSDYQLSGLEITVSKDRKKKTGTLFPAAQLKLNDEGKLVIETFQNPWTLSNIYLR